MCVVLLLLRVLYVLYLVMIDLLFSWCCDVCVGWYCVCPFRLGLYCACALLLMSRDCVCGLLLCAWCIFVCLFYEYIELVSV